MAASRGAGQGPSVRPEARLAAVPLRGRPLPAWPRGVSSARPPQALRGRPVLSPYEAPSLSRTYCTHSCPLSMAGRPPRLTPLPPGEWLTCSAILSSVPPAPRCRPHRLEPTGAGSRMPPPPRGSLPRSQSWSPRSLRQPGRPRGWPVPCQGGFFLFCVLRETVEEEGDMEPQRSAPPSGVLAPETRETEGGQWKVRRDLGARGTPRWLLSARTARPFP